MSNIEVGDYLRIFGKIAKVTAIDGDYIDVDNEELIGIPKECLKYTIYNHSKNIIDLIEVGDIVEIQKGLYDIQKIIIENEETLISVQESLKNYAVLKSIVTKEMYESVKYEVK